jgi:hypothetical protein
MARTQWAKITTDTSTSPSIADLWAEGAVGRDALVIFFMSLAHGGVYGLLPGDLRRFGGLVCPLFGLSTQALQERIDLLVQHGFYQAYTIEDKDCFWIRNYHHFQDVRWARVGPPEYPLPDEWEVPDDLRKQLLKDLTAKEPHDPTEWGLRKVHLQAVDAQLVVRWCSNSGQLQESPGNSRSLRATPGGSRLDVDVDVDSDTNPDVEGDSDSDLTPEPSRGKRLGETGDLPYLKIEYANLWSVCRDLPWKTGRIRETWLADIAAAIESQSDAWIDDDFQAAELLRQYPPKGAEKHLPSKWLGRVEKEVAGTVTAKPPEPPLTPQQRAANEHAAMLTERVRKNLAAQAELASTVSEGGARDE